MGVSDEHLCLKILPQASFLNGCRPNSADEDSCKSVSPLAVIISKGGIIDLPIACPTDLKYLTCPPKTDPTFMLGSGKGGRSKCRGKATRSNKSSPNCGKVLLSQGQTVGDICRSFNISEQTYYRWRKEYGGIRTDQVRRLKELEKENARLKKLVADLSLDNSILRETVRGNPGLVPGQADQPGQAQAGGGTRQGSVPGV
jgi:hypothetical protein